jgi:hypothetical protein
VQKNYNLTFRRNLVGGNLLNWNYMVQIVRNIQLNDYPVRLIWSLNKNGNFSMKSMYVFLEKTLAGAHYKWILVCENSVENRKIYVAISGCHSDKRQYEKAEVAWISSLFFLQSK